MKKQKYDPTSCLLSALYAWEQSQRAASEDVSRWLAEAVSWVWLFRMVGAPLYVEG